MPDVGRTGGGGRAGLDVVIYLLCVICLIDYCCYSCVVCLFLESGSRFPAGRGAARGAPGGDEQTWLILPVVICLSQRLSHASLSLSVSTAKLRMARYNSCSLFDGHSYAGAGAARGLRAAGLAVRLLPVEVHQAVGRLFCVC